MKKRSFLTRTAAWIAAFGAPLAGPQVAGQTDGMSPATRQADDTVVLSPFTVETDNDTGYFAENTLAGSRLNSSLRDTAASVSVFTREFLDDVAITDISELVRYSVNTEINTSESQNSSNEQNAFVNAQNITTPILIRGLQASMGLDYFTSITPTDPYRVGRYEDSRGPNSILFGVGSPGGLLNQSSKTASVARDRAQIRYSTGSRDRNRSEIDVNKVLRKGRLAMSLAGLHQENGGWRTHDFQDKDRVFGTVTFRPVRTLTLTAMGEKGRDFGAVIRTTGDTDQVLAWYDNREAFGIDAVTFVPTTALPTAAMQAVGVTSRDGTRGGQVRRAIFIENDGTVFNAAGTYLTGSYNNAVVRAPDGTPGETASVLRLNDPSFYPRELNAAGPGMNRRQSLSNYTLSADWQITPRLTVNLAHNYQETTAEVTLMTGTEPTLRGDPNRTLGIGGPANPYAGRLYFDGNWRHDVHDASVRETRIAVSYTLEPKWKWLGRHRVAAMAAHTEQLSVRAISWLALAGRPFNAVPNNVNNRLTVRNYLTEGDFSTYRVGDYRKLPATVDFDGRTYGLVWANEVAGANNSGGQQETDSLLGVIQSRLLDDRLVVTAGYREDRVSILEFGYYNHPDIGDIVDRDPSKGQSTEATGRTGTLGAVYHLMPWLSLVGNHSSNTGTPSLTRKIFPDGDLAPPSEGKGSDIGVNLDLFGGKLSAKIVYFTSQEHGRISVVGLGAAPERNMRVMDAFGSVLVGAGRPYTESAWSEIYRGLTPPANAIAADVDAEGYETRITANLTRNWRLIVNYSWTDQVRRNLANEMAVWYGLKSGADGQLQQGVSQDSSGRFIVDPSAYDAGGTVAQWLDFAAKHPEAAVGTLTTTNGVTIAEEIFGLVNTLNNDKETQERRWGLRPHKVSLYSAYDFRGSRLKGFTVGGGWRYQSANVIGADSSGREISGSSIVATDLMLAYTHKFSRVPGRFRFQINVSNVFDKTDIIPVRIARNNAATPDGFEIPGGRGLGYSRYDLVPPREIRFTTTWSY